MVASFSKKGEKITRFLAIIAIASLLIPLLLLPTKSVSANGWPGAPTIFSPADGENTNDSTPTITWGAVSDDFPPILYQVIIDNNSDFSSPENNSGWIDTTYYTPSALLDNLYYLRVCAKDNAGNVGDNSQLSFRVDTVAPTVTIAVSQPLINEGDDGGSFDVEVTFSEPMDTGFTPTITFAPDVEGSNTLTFASEDWTVGDTVYTATYDIADVDEEVTGVDVSVGGAQDLAGNVQDPDPTTEADLFDVDTVAIVIPPPVEPVNPPVVEPVNPPVVEPVVKPKPKPEPVTPPVVGPVGEPDNGLQRQRTAELVIVVAVGAIIFLSMIIVQPYVIKKRKPRRRIIRLKEVKDDE